MVTIVFIIRAVIAAFLLGVLSVGLPMEDFPYASYAGLASFIAWIAEFISLMPIIRGRVPLLPVAALRYHVSWQNILTSVRWLAGVYFAMAGSIKHSEWGFTIGVMAMYLPALLILSPLDKIAFPNRKWITLACYCGVSLVWAGAIMSYRKQLHDIAPLDWLMLTAGVALLLVGTGFNIIAGKHESIPLAENGKPDPAEHQPIHTLEEPPKNDASIGKKTLKQAFEALAILDPQKRGYIFHNFLKDLFAAHNLSLATVVRMSHEEISGSFEIGAQTYLLEAKWQAKPCDEGNLLAFNGKVEGKSSWARGLFISYSGFSDSGLTAFAVGKRTSIIGMDGEDITHILDGKISIERAINEKVRRAGETNSFFTPLREITVVPFNQK